MQHTFQRAQEFCDEAQKYMDLIAQEEADARRRLKALEESFQFTSLSKQWSVYTSMS